MESSSNGKAIKNGCHRYHVNQIKEQSDCNHSGAILFCSQANVGESGNDLEACFCDTDSCNKAIKTEQRYYWVTSLSVVLFLHVFSTNL